MTNASNFIRGYDPRHRRGAVAARRQLEDHRADAGLRRRTSSSSPAAARPSGRSSRSRPAARGDITPRRGPTRARIVVWTQDRPRLVHADAARSTAASLYVLGNDGLFDAYDLADRRARSTASASHRGSGFSASPVAADGRIYLSSEDGDIFVVPSGPSSSSWARTRWASR